MTVCDDGWGFSLNLRVMDRSVELWQGPTAGIGRIRPFA